MLLYFLNALKKLITTKSGQIDICATILLEAKSKPKHEENIFWGFFSLKPKNVIFLSSFQNSNFEFVFLRLFYNVKGSFMRIFTKNINI